MIILWFGSSCVVGGWFEWLGCWGVWFEGFFWCWLVDLIVDRVIDVSFLMVVVWLVLVVWWWLVLDMVYGVLVWDDMVVF